jgi:prolyl-tRNA synthetase
MSHSDDLGLVLPPKMAPIQLVIVPIYSSEEELAEVMEVAKKIKSELDNKISVKLDDRDTKKPGVKFFEWEKKGVPVRMEIGPKDIKQGKAVLVRRDLNQKQSIALEGISGYILNLLEDIQKDLFEKNKKFREDNTVKIDNYNDFKEIYTGDGSFVISSWCEGAECEAKIQEETKATIRSLPMDGKQEEGNCIYCGKASKIKAVFAKSY